MDTEFDQENPETQEDQDDAVETEKIQAPSLNSAWTDWKSSPDPARMARVIQAARPIIDRSVSRISTKSPAASAHAKMLAIGAIKSFDPARGASLKTHLYTNLKPLGRIARAQSSLIPKSRLELDRSNRLTAGVNFLRESINREPTDTELMDHMMVDPRELKKMRLAGHGDVAESTTDSAAVDNGDSERLNRWSNYVYHDLDPMGKLIMDLRMGRNGRTPAGMQEIVTATGMSMGGINKRLEGISKRILEGAGSSGGQR